MLAAVATVLAEQLSGQLKKIEQSAKELGMCQIPSDV